MSHVLQHRRKAFRTTEVGTNPGTGDLVAWYDFNDTVAGEGNDDSHSTFDLNEVNTPTYVTTSPEHAVCASTAHLTSTTLDSNFGDVDGDWSYVFRFKWNTTRPSFKEVIDGAGTRHYIRLISPLTYRVRIVGITFIPLTVAGNLDGVWTTVVATFDSVANEGKAYLTNEGLSGTDAHAGSFSTGTFLFGDTSNSFDLDFAGFWNKTLTDENADWFGQGTSESLHKNFSDL